MQPRNQRFRIRLIAVIVATNSQRFERLVLYTENVSITGALLKTTFGAEDSPIEIGDQLSLLMQLPAIDDRDHELRCNATVVRGDGDRGFGVHFNFVEPVQQQILQSYLSRFVAEFPESIL